MPARSHALKAAMPEILTAPAPRPAARTQAISLRQLRFFTALADTGNFSRAAERMIVSQPALSAGIRQIEEHLGVRLFERSTHHGFREISICVGNANCF